MCRKKINFCIQSAHRDNVYSPTSLYRTAIPKSLILVNRNCPSAVNLNTAEVTNDAAPDGDHRHHSDRPDCDCGNLTFPLVYGERMQPVQRPVTTVWLPMPQPIRRVMVTVAAERSTPVKYRLELMVMLL